MSTAKKRPPKKKDKGGMDRLHLNTRVFLWIFLGMFVFLGSYTFYTVQVNGSTWFASSYNTRLKTAQKRVVVGNILDRDGAVLADTDGDGNRSYPLDRAQRLALCHVLGDPAGVAPGVDTTYAGYLLGFNNSVFEKIYQAVNLEKPKGNDVAITVDADLQYAAADAMDGRKGAVALINYKTGEVLSLYASPGFDPANVSDYLEGTESELVNRATNGKYPPGSIFKIVTVAAYLDAGYSMDDTYLCEAELIVNGQKIVDQADHAHGEQTVTQALNNSCNIAFAQMAQKIGKEQLLKTAQAFGFNEGALYSDLQLAKSSVTFDEDDGDDALAWAACGQHKDLITPLQAAMMIGAIANDGEMMEPKLLYEVTNSRGDVVKSLNSSVAHRAASSQNARIIQQMLISTVEQGTASAVQIDGYTVGGKTGTAQPGGDQGNHAWFVAYVADDAHPLAIAVVVENGGTGGKVAGPVAARVLKTALGADN